MLVIGRRHKEGVRLDLGGGESIVVMCRKRKDGKIELAIEAPPRIKIIREDNPLLPPSRPCQTGLGVYLARRKEKAVA